MNVDVILTTRERLEADDDLRKQLKSFCDKAYNDFREPAHINMSWSDKPHTLYSQIFHQFKYDEDTGRLFLGYIDGELVAVSGAYHFENEIDTVICGARTWTLRDWRTKYVHGDYIFPAQFEWAKHNGYKKAYLTFNSYNSWLFKFLRRIADGKGTAFGLKNCDTYKDLKFLDEPKTINYVDQFVAVKNL